MKKLLHPEYIDIIVDYKLMRDTHKGQRTIKEEGKEYLSPTNGQRHDGFPNIEPGKSAYESYRERAVFDSFVQESVKLLMGTLYSKPVSFTLPTSINYLLEESTPDKEPLHVLMQRVSHEQLLVGRIGLLVDVPVNGGNPYIVTYTAESIIDWDTGFIDGENKLTYVCLNISGYVRTINGWEIEDKLKLLRLTDGVYETAIVTDSSDEPVWITPKAKGKTLTEIPFTFVNSIDLSTSPSQPILINVANESISAYRQTADYYQAIFHQAQATAVITGAVADSDGNVPLGAGAMLHLPEGATLTYAEVSGAGLAEQRIALENTRAKASAFTSSFLKDSGSNSSGEAIRVRLEASSSSLKNIAIAGQYGLISALKHCLLFAGGAGNVIVQPNLDFNKKQLVASELKQYIEAKNLGALISEEMLHDFMRKGGLTLLDLDEIKKQIKKEDEEKALKELPLIPETEEPNL